MLKVIAKWFLLVSLNAAGSFYWAIATNYDDVEEILAMLCGIAIFVMIYTRIELRLGDLNHEFGLRILRYGIIVRTIFVIIVPIGIMIDFFFGIVVIGFLEKIPHFTQLGEFSTTLATTLAQGSLLSILVGLCGLIIEGIRRAWRAFFPLDTQTEHSSLYTKSCE